MGVKLRHVNGRNLGLLEKQLEKTDLAIVIQQITKDGDEWYIHFLVQGVAEEPQKITEEKIFKTKQLFKE